MDNKYALVTGASSGIGFQYARVLAGYGYNLVIVSNEEAINERSVELMNEFPVKVIPVLMDLSLQTSPQQLYDFCSERQLEVEFLVNNAGVYHDKDFLDDSLKFNTLILNLHVCTPALLVWHFAQDMVKRQKGYIINMSSVASGFGIQRLSTYSSTKSFLKIFSRATHVELHNKGVNLTCVRPGAVATTLYNLKPSLMKVGIALGIITTPQKLARRAVKAALRGRAQITPGFYTKLLQFLVALIPTCALRLVRRMKIF